MNIFLRELKISVKAFVIWSAVLAVFVFAAMYEFNALEEDISQFFDLFPRVVLIVMGANPDIDISQSIGYYSMINYYFIICLIFYSIGRGGKAVSGEIIDKTHEFLFTKPISRNKIMTRKIAAGAALVTALNLVLFIMSVFSLLAFDKVSPSIFLFFLSNTLISLLFFSVSCFINSYLAKHERASQYALLVLLAAFIIGIIYDIVGKGWYIQIFTPIKYFEAKKLVDNSFNIFYAVFVSILSAVFIFFSYRFYGKKDLK